jgi:cobalt-zinc-cadmium efflux system membrane fusion protein
MNNKNSTLSVVISLGVLASVITIGWLTTSDKKHEDEIAEVSPSETIIKLSPFQINKAGIQVGQAAPAKMKITLTIPGRITLNADKHAHVVAKAAGIVRNAYKNLGDNVNEGEVLALLESREIAEAKAHYLAAYQKEQLTKDVLDREQTMVTKKIGIEKDLVEAKSKSEEARIDLELATQKLCALDIPREEIAQLSNNNTQDLRVYSMKAPLQGVIIDRAITPGEKIDSDREAYTIADLRTVWLELGIHPQDLPQVHVGQTVSVTTADSSWTVQAQIASINPIVDEVTKRAKALVVLNNDAGLWYPGTYASATLVIEEVHAAIAVPKEAVQTIDGTPCVFVEHAEGFEKRCVRLGKANSKMVEIVAGLDEGVPYAVTNTFLLKADLGKADAED